MAFNLLGTHLLSLLRPIYRLYFPRRPYHKQCNFIFVKPWSLTPAIICCFHTRFSNNLTISVWRGRRLHT
ncbi:hypothetical protein FGO68_gene14778 [Halteria grandinella]|uniref:Uncharacterized protein n=1 Tax=Halteria grandinella TaxID=5974 RepID=A0A8J8TAY7_HALGN|nr:hypothetical protein FGO68_gene14778 [Halteria grandinella]